MSAEDRSFSELSELLVEQLRFIENSAISYDQGFKGEAKRIALTIRVIVHDTNRSESLLSQLGHKDDAEFVDSCIPFDPNNLFSHCGLIKHLHADGAMCPVPLFEDSPAKPRIVPFDEWWHGIVFVSNDGALFSRRDIVLTMANKEGGGHVDLKLDADFTGLTRLNPPGWSMHTPDKVVPASNPVPAALRQIAHEVLASLSNNYVAPHPELPENAFVLSSPMAHFADMPPSLPARNTVKRSPSRVGRNSPCYCGSGKKYKKCCGK